MKTCKQCQTPYDPYTRSAPRATWWDIERMEYCSEACARRAENQRYYHAHKNHLNQTRTANRRKKSKD